MRNFKEIKINSVYSISEILVYAAGLATTESFNLNNYNRAFKLKSIYFDFEIREEVSQQRLPLEQNTTQLINLVIGGTNDILIAKIFEDQTHPINVAYNGEATQMFRPGQLFFDNWYITNVLPFHVYYNNNDPLMSYQVWWNITAEIEPIE